MDHIDWAILDALQRDGRMPNRDLASVVHLSEAQCSRRLQRLVERGVIEGFTALVNRAATNLSLTVFVDVYLLPPVGSHLASFEAQLLKVPEVLECRRLLGEVDYQLRW